MEFKAITTQEEFDQAISERLKRERETIAKNYGDYDDIKARNEDLEKQLVEMNNSLVEKTATYDQGIANLTAQMKAHELTSLRSKIAYETGIPYELASRLSGEDEDSIRKDAETLSKLVSIQQVPPLRSTEPMGEDKDAPYKALLNQFEGE